VTPLIRLQRIDEQVVRLDKPIADLAGEFHPGHAEDMRGVNLNVFEFDST